MTKVNFIFLSFVTVLESMMNVSYCGNVFPAEGTWLRDKPYWNIKGCPSKSYDSKSTLESLAGRTVYVLGNSIARQVIFSISTLLGEEHVNRSTQKSQCPRDGMWYGGACGLEVKGVKLKFKYFDYMDGFDYSQRGGFPFVFQKNESISFKDVNEACEYYGQAGPLAFKFKQKDAAVLLVKNAREDVRSSLQTFFNGSTSTDILIFNLGMKYATRSKFIDYPSWLVSSAKGFRDHVAATFKGKIFRITLSEVHKVFICLLQNTLFHKYISKDISRYIQCICALYTSIHICMNSILLIF